MTGFRAGILGAIAEGGSYDVLLHLGAGSGRDLAACLATDIPRLVLTEADPVRARALRRAAGKDPRVEILDLAVTDHNGPATLHHLSLPDRSGLRAPTGLKTLYPGLRALGETDVEAIDLPTLLTRTALPDPRSPSGPGTGILILDGHGEEAVILEQLDAAGRLIGFTDILLRLPALPLYEGAPDGDALQSWLEARDYRVAAEDRSDPDLPEMHFRFGAQTGRSGRAGQVPDTPDSPDKILTRLVADMDLAVARLARDPGATQGVATRLADLRDQARALTGTAPRHLRCLHHLACTGGTLIAQCLSAQPDTWLLSEVDPLSPIAHTHPFVPTDMIGLARFSSQPGGDDLDLALFRAGLDVLYDTARDRGLSLILRDHAHGHFSHGPEIPDRPTLDEILLETYQPTSLVSVRHPLDSYLSLMNNKWVHFTPGTLAEYCRRYHVFLDRHQGMARLRYEDFVTEPDRHMAWICDLFDLAYSPDYARLFPDIILSGGSGRVSRTIGPLRPRRPIPADLTPELRDNAPYEALCDRLGYDPDPEAPFQPT
ncbi:hypothetical protein [Shimia biformata]|uniref:hypothetical protein n=1 Tax=Shimia biformata TaxID=1294299 RepID=UPI00194F3A4D|nr:hypothetical protein [Shimia biformata]